MYDISLHEMHGYWIDAQCGCGQRYVMPVEELARTCASGLKLGDASTKISCFVCRNNPAAVYVSNYNPNDPDMRRRGDRWKLYTPWRRMPTALPEAPLQASW